MKFKSKFKGFNYQIEYEYCGKRYITTIQANNEIEAIKKLNMKYPYSLRIESIVGFLI